MSDARWSCEENEVTLHYGTARLKVEVRKPLNPHEPPDAVVSMHVAGRREAYYMVLTADMWDDFAWRLENLRYQLEDRRPIQGCRNLESKNAVEMALLERITRDMYEPGIAAQLNDIRPLLGFGDTRD